MARQIAEVANRARPFYRCALGCHAAKHALHANDFANVLFIAQPVLEADGDGVLSQEMQNPPHRRLGIGSFALNEDNIHRVQAARVCGRADGNMAIAAVADDLEAVPVDAIYMILPHIDQGHVQPTLCQQPPEQTAHRASANNGDCRFPNHHAQLLSYGYSVSRLDSGQ